MANHFSLLLLTLLLTTATTTALISAAETPSPSSSSTPSKPKTSPYSPPPVPQYNSAPPHNPPPRHNPPSPPAKIQGDQLNNILDALIGAGDFAGWANILSSADPSALPLSATLFIPNNAAISNLPSSSAVKTNIDSFLIPYHIVLQRLTFSGLQKYPIGTRLPTLLPSKFIIITNNSRLNFTINNSPITHPDIFVTGAFSVHGIKNVLSYSPTPYPPRNTTSTAPRYNLKPKNKEPGVPKEIGPRSAAICIEFFRIVWIVCVVFCIQGFVQ